MTHLPKGYIVRVDEPADVTVICLHGSLWATQLGDFRDYYLHAGQRLALAPHGMVILSALEDSVCRIVHATRGGAGLRIDEGERRICWAPL